MPKRFTSTEIWEEDWFLEMPNEYKLFWFYILSKCDHAGIYRVNVKKFCLSIEKKINSDKALSYFNNGKERIRILSENKWFIEDFFVFQYGEILNKNSKVHESIEHIYNQANIKMTSIRGLKGLKDRVIDKDKDKERKGGAGGKTNQDNKGISFDGENVILENGKKQKLGKNQLFRLSINDLTPEQICEGYIT